MSQVKQIIKQTLKATILLTKSYKLFKPFFSGVGHILMFHRVCPESTGPRIPFNTLMEVTPQYLENTVLCFKRRGYEFISLDTLYLRFQENNFKRKFVVVTFDDGYKDNLTHALPILKKHDVPFTIYVSTNFPNHRAVLWWDLLEELVLERECIEINVGDKRLSFSCKNMQEKEDTYSSIRKIIIGFSQAEFLDKISELFRGLVDDIHSKSVESALNWEQVVALSKEPLVTIGAHTVNHYALKHLSPEQSRYEIYESKKEIESHIQEPVEHFAYPFGGPLEVGKKDLAIVEECKFKTATSTVPGNIFKCHKDHLNFLPRIQMYEEFDKTRLELFIDGLTQFKLNGVRRCS